MIRIIYIIFWSNGASRVIKTICGAFLFKVLHGNIKRLCKRSPCITSGILKISNKGCHISADAVGDSATTCVTASTLIEKFISPVCFVAHFLQNTCNRTFISVDNPITISIISIKALRIVYNIFFNSNCKISNCTAKRISIIIYINISVIHTIVIITVIGRNSRSACCIKIFNKLPA